MRITGGILRGRTIRVPAGIRPTQDRVRLALFSMLAGRIPGAQVLDLYAGSGALGLEAWSRGAASVTWVERDPRMFRILEGNVADLCGETGGAARYVRAEALAFLRGVSDSSYDVILADPPYTRQAGVDPILENVLQVLDLAPILAPGGLLVFEDAASGPPFSRAGWSALRSRVYGDTRLLVLARSSELAGGDDNGE